MFKRLAISGLAKLWPARPQAVAPARHAFGPANHSNDNLPGFRRPAATGKRRSPPPALACHWIERGGRLECHWHPVAGDTPTGGHRDHQESAPGRASARPTGSRYLALAG
jgi:hypothetical protein